MSGLWRHFRGRGAACTLCTIGTARGGVPGRAVRLRKGAAEISFFGKQAIFLCILATLMLPIEVLMVPTFVLVKNLNWLDSYQSLIIPATALAFGVFLMRQTMLHVPDPLIDAARIDGASEVQIYFQIVMPLLWPAVPTLALLEFRESWDSFVWPLIVIFKTRCAPSRSV